MDMSARQARGASAPQSRRRITPLPVHPGEAHSRPAKPPPTSPLQRPKPQLALLTAKTQGNQEEEEVEEEEEEEEEEADEDDEDVIEVEPPQLRHTKAATPSALTGGSLKSTVSGAPVHSQKAFSSADAPEAESSRVHKSPKSDAEIEEVESKIQRAEFRDGEAPVRPHGAMGGGTEPVRGKKQDKAQKAGRAHGLDDRNLGDVEYEDADMQEEEEEGEEEEDDDDEDEDDEEDQEEEGMVDTHRRLEDLGASASEQHVQACIDDLIILEGKQHDAQERLEDEALEQVRADIEQELAESRKYQKGSTELAEAVEDELETLRDMWEEKIERRAQRITQLQELLTCYSPDINLNDVYIHLEKQAVEAAKTRAWKERAHWFGVHAKVDEAKAERQFPAGAQGHAHAPADFSKHSSDDFEKPFVLAEDAKNCAWKREAEAHTLQRCDKPAGAHGYLVRRIKGLREGGRRRLAQASDVQSEEPIKWATFRAQAEPADAIPMDAEGAEGDAAPADLSADPWRLYRADNPLEAEQLGLEAQVEEIMDLRPGEKAWQFKDDELSQKQRMSIRKWAHESDEIICRRRNRQQVPSRITRKRKLEAQTEEHYETPEEAGAAGKGAATEEPGTEQSQDGQGMPAQPCKAKSRTPEKPPAMRQIIEIDDVEGCHRIVHEPVQEPAHAPKASPSDDELVDADDYEELLRHISGSKEEHAPRGGGGNGPQVSGSPAAASQADASNRAAVTPKPRGRPRKQVDEAENGKWQCTICLERGRVLAPEERLQQEQVASGSDAAAAEELKLVLHSHPTLKVCLCEACHKQRSSAIFTSKGAKEDKCHWCGLFIVSGLEPLPSDSLGQNTSTRALSCGVQGCSHVFCSKCVRSNLGQVALADIELSVGREAEWAMSKWACLKCNSTPLRKMQKLCKDLLKLRDGATQGSAEGKGASKGRGKGRPSGKAVRGEPLLPESETGAEPRDGADADGNLLSTGGKRSKIRRIMDDSEIKDKGFLDQQEAERIRREKLKEWEADARRRRAQAQRWRKSRKGKGKGKGKDAMQEDSEEEDVEELMYGKVINTIRDAQEEPIRIDPEISRHLRPHQVEGVRFMWQNCIQKVASVEAREKGLGCILAHCMGLGKTLQVIALVHTVLSRFFRAGRIRTVLVVVPTAVLFNWQEEFRRWVPDPQGPNDTRYGVHVLNEPSNEQRWKKLLKWKMEGGVMIIGYRTFSLLCLGTRIADKEMRDNVAGCLQDPGPDMLICDEAHTIKNPLTDATQALKRVRTQRRIALTGSPLQNNLDEYYCMVDFVREGYLGTPNQFKNRFKNPIENGQKADSSAVDVRIMRQRSHVLTEQLKGFVQRKAAETVIRDLPSRHVYAVFVRLSPLQRKLYRFYCDHIVAAKAPKGSVAEGLAAAREPGKGGDQKSTASGLKTSTSRSGGKGSLFVAYAASTKIWTHPRTLAIERKPSGGARRKGALAEAGREDGAVEDEVEVDEEEEALEQELEQDDEDDLGRSSALRDQLDAGSAPESGAPRKGKDGFAQHAPWWEGLLDGPVSVKGSSATASSSDAAIPPASQQGVGLEAGDVPEERRMQEYVQESGKMAVVLELLRLAERAGDRVLVFSIHLDALDLLELFLSQGLATSSGLPEERRWKKGVHWFRIDGSTKASDRQDIVRTFNNEKASPLARCVLVTTGAGGVGLNLVGANRIILMDSHWNPAADLQATFRSWRYGQTKDVFVYRLLAAETMEEKIYNRQVAKEGLSARVVDEQQVGRLFKEEDLKDYFVAPAAGTPEKPKRPQSADAAAGDQEKGAAGSDDPESKPDDALLCRLLEGSHSRWVAKWHEHERLLQEVEEKLSEEEQEQAWKAFAVLEDAEEAAQPAPTFLGFKYNPGLLGFLLIDTIMQDALAGAAAAPGAGVHVNKPAPKPDAAPP